MALIKPKTQTVQLARARDTSSYMAAQWVNSNPKLRNGNSKYVIQSANFLERINIILESPFFRVIYDLWRRGKARLQIMMKVSAHMGSQIN
jgi:hypothetical protein